MKKKLIALALILGLLLCGCYHPPEPTEIYLIPNSFLAFNTMDHDEALEFFQDFGPDYCTDVQSVDDGIQLTLTEKQLAHWIEHNNEEIEKFFSDLAEINSEFHFERDENFQHVAFYLDENIPMITHAMRVYGVAAYYGLNYLLLNHAEDWSVEVSLYNCHTNKLVARVNIPYESVSYGDEEWAKSYE